MRTSSEGIELIKKWEGCRLIAYNCAAGVWTIGYGHTQCITKGMTITKEQAEQLLLEDIAKYENKVNKYYEKYKFTQNQFDALVSFAFNVGNIDELTKNGTRKISTISNKILLYCNAGGKKLKGLENRRKEEKALFDRNVDYDVTKIAKEVIQGKYGNGEERKQKLTELGYNYYEIQKKVNELLK